MKLMDGFQVERKGKRGLWKNIFGTKNNICTQKKAVASDVLYRKALLNGHQDPNTSPSWELPAPAADIHTTPSTENDGRCAQNSLKSIS